MYLSVDQSASVSVFSGCLSVHQWFLFFPFYAFICLSVLNVSLLFPVCVSVSGVGWILGD